MSAALRPVALLSGANRGIGAEIARQLAGDHGFLALRGSRHPGGDEEQLDVSDVASVDALAARIAIDPGRLDVLVNNAGIHGGSYNDSFEQSDIEAGMNVLTRTLAADCEVLVNSMCPGWVRTEMGGSNAPRSVTEGADTAVWLATLPDDGPSGGYFRDRKPIPW